MKTIRFVWRILRITEHTITGAIIASWITVLQAAGHDPGWRLDAVCWWYSRLCRVIGIRMRISGAPKPSALLVGNHISWLDIPVIGSQGRVCFLSKSEVRSWPLIGWFAAIANTVFIERGVGRFDSIRQQITERILGGQSTLIFPEGTTGDGHHLRPFHPRLFGVAQDSDIPIQPVAIFYGSDGKPDAIAPFHGVPLLQHVIRILSHPGLTAEIVFLPDYSVENLDRRSLAVRARAAIQSALDHDVTHRDSSGRPARPGRTVAQSPAVSRGSPQSPTR